MRTTLLAILIALLPLAGCLEAEESRDDDSSDARHFTVDVPAGATQVHVDVTARATAGEPDVTVLIEDEGGANLATDTWSVGGSSTRRVSADVSGQARLVVAVEVVDGNAELDVRVSATVPGAQPVVIVEERIVLVVVQPTAAPTTTPPPTATPTTPPSPTVTPTPTPSPTPTPTATPTPTVTPTTNTTNTTNSTANATG